MPPFFSPARLFKNTLWFVASIAFCYSAGIVLRGTGLHFVSQYFPVNMFAPRGMSVLLVLAGLMVWLAGMGMIWWCERQRYPVWAVCAAGLLMVLGTNFLQGVAPNREISRGFAFPINGKTSAIGVQYYHDAREVVSPAAFIRHFAAIQPHLHDHGRTHPPGAVLLFYALNKITGGRPLLIGFVLAAFSVLVSGGAMACLVRMVLPGESNEPTTNAGFAALLLLLLPAAQVYFCATLDGVVAALLLAGVAFAVKKQTLLSALCVFTVSFLTFGAVWVVPVLGAVAVRGKNWKPFATTLGLVVAVYCLLYAAFGFNYLAALRTASRLENPDGFRLFSDPLGYLVTRWEDIAEIALFTGPFVLGAAWQGMRLTSFRKKTPDAFWLFAAACTTLAGLFLTGAYRTGETARACLFVYPFLLLPVVGFLRNKCGEFNTLSEEPNRAQKTLLIVIWTQSVLMQVIGDYFW